MKGIRLILLIKFSCLLITLTPLFSRAQYNKVDFYPPEAASLMKKVDYPVSHLTGMPDIKIPLHTIKAGALTLPVELSFHIDNFIKANQMPGAAGAGWSLSTELQISRAINGGDDLHPLKGYCVTNTVPASYTNGFQSRTRAQMKRMVDGVADEEPDKFYYQLLGKSGSFYFQKQSNGTFIPVSVPYNGVKISYNFTTQQFTIIDTDGTTYLFSTSKTEWSGNINGTVSQTLAWKCAEIKNAAGVQEMAFTYANNYQAELYSFNDRLELHDDIFTASLSTDTWGPKCYVNPAPFWQVTGPKIMAYGSASSRMWAYSHTGGFEDMGSRGEGAPSQSIQYTKKHALTGISFRGGSLVFNYINNGELTSIQIKEANSTTVKNVDFFQTYTKGNIGASFVQSAHEHSRILDSIKVNDQKYSFTYGFTRQYGDVYDFWGYLAEAPNTTAYPNILRHAVDVSMGSCEFFYDCYANDPMTPLSTTIAGKTLEVLFDTAAGKLTALTINYPTGGKTEFLVEENRFRDQTDQSIKRTGGWRIERIRSFDGVKATPANEKIYKYGPDEDGTGIIKNMPSTDPYTGNCMLLENNTYVTGAGNLTTRKRTYFSTPTGGLSFWNGSLVNYHTVTEYNSDMGVLTGKTVYKYDFYSYSPEYTSPTDPYPFERNDWDKGLPDSVIHYKYKNGQFVWVKKKNMDYNTYTQPYKIFQGRASLRGNYILVSESATSQDEWTENFGNLEYKYSAIEVGATQLTHEVEIEKDDNGNTLTTSTNYFYNNPDPSLATRIERTGSDGLTTIQHITYPGDYAAGGFITPLVTNNIVSVPVEKVVRKNGKIVSAQLLTYNSNGTLATSHQIESSPALAEASFKMSNRTTNGDYTVPGSNSSFAGDSKYLQKLSLDWDISYLNLKQVTPTAGMPVSYLWAYDNQYPVAQVNNAPVDKIAYTSFENSQNGGWTFSGVPGFSVNPPTGNKAYDISNSITRTGLIATDLYIVSYWRNSAAGPLTVAGSIAGNGYPKTGPTLNGWTYYEHKVNGATVTSISGTGLIDELRLYPATAQMITYTYAPLIGMTSQCDAGNRITYYEYDSFGRLKVIRDQDKNVLKTFDYQYQKNINQ